MSNHSTHCLKMPVKNNLCLFVCLVHLLVDFKSLDIPELLVVIEYPEKEAPST